MFDIKETTEYVHNRCVEKYGLVNVKDAAAISTIVAVMTFPMFLIMLNACRGIQ